MDDLSLAYRNPARLLQKLVQFDTTNPPGNEAACIAFINDLLTLSGVETKILARSPERPNLIARLPGQGNAAPLLLYGHVDVVTAENQQWQHPPFEGKTVDGYVWGRGTLDMKGGIAMMLAAFLRAKSENMKPACDVVLTVLSDEEAGGDFGAKWLVENHPAEFGGIRYAIGEVGGFSSCIGKRRFYPIQVAEKQICWLKVTVRGPGGHGSLPSRGGAVAKLSRALQRLSTRRLPAHVTPPVRLMLRTLASELGGPSGLLVKGLLNPRLTDAVLNLLGLRGHLFDPLLHNTASPTILHGSSKINVIPSEASVELDGRLLPGLGPDVLVSEVRAIVGEDADCEVIRHDPGPAKPDMALFGTLSRILTEADPKGIPLPTLLSGGTDARFFSRLGIQTYGFLPMRLPDSFDYTQTIHAADERVPVEAIDFGANAIYRLLQRIGA